MVKNTPMEIKSWTNVSTGILTVVYVMCNPRWIWLIWFFPYIYIWLNVAKIKWIFWVLCLDLIYKKIIALRFTVKKLRGIMKIMLWTKNSMNILVEVYSKNNPRWTHWSLRCQHSMLITLWTQNSTNILAEVYPDANFLCAVHQTNINNNKYL